jgi:hypothetical protein
MSNHQARLTNLRMTDGSRLFATLPMTVLWDRVHDHVAKLEGADQSGFLCDGVTEAWIDFRYCNHAFTINDQFDEYWLFVDDPACPDEILFSVIGHFEALLGK